MSFRSLMLGADKDIFKANNDKFCLQFQDWYNNFKLFLQFNYLYNAINISNRI